MKRITLLMILLAVLTAATARAAEWERVGNTDTSTFQFLLNKIKLIYISYDDKKVSYFKQWQVRKESGETWIYRGEDFTLAIDLKYSSGIQKTKMARWLISGSVNYKDVTILLLEKIKEYMDRHGYTIYYGLTPKDMRSSQTKDFTLNYWHVNITEATLIEETAGYWHYEIPAPSAQNISDYRLSLPDRFYAP